MLLQFPAFRFNILHFLVFFLLVVLVVLVAPLLLWRVVFVAGVQFHVLHRGKMSGGKTNGFAFVKDVVLNEIQRFFNTLASHIFGGQ